jgi:hypothetical protein
MPYEEVFSKMNKKARYKGLARNRFQILMQAFSYNLKIFTKIAAPPLNFYVSQGKIMPKI